MTLLQPTKHDRWEGRSQAGVKVASEAVADGGEAAGAVKAQVRGAAVVDGSRTVGVSKREYRLRVRQRCEAVQLHHVRRLKVLQVVVHLAKADQSADGHVQQEMPLMSCMGLAAIEFQPTPPHPSEEAWDGAICMHTTAWLARFDPKI